MNDLVMKISNIGIVPNDETASYDETVNLRAIYLKRGYWIFFCSFNPEEIVWIGYLKMFKKVIKVGGG
jgi:hypothetical protein